MAKTGRRKAHKPTPAARQAAAHGGVPADLSRREPPEVVALRSIGHDLVGWMFGPPPGRDPVPLGFVARLGPELLAAHRTTAAPGVARALVELFASLGEDTTARRALQALHAVLDELDDDPALAYLQGVAATTASASLKLQHGDALAGAIAVLRQRGDDEAIARLVADRLAECVELARGPYGLVLGTVLLRAARGQAIGALADAVLDARAAPAFGVDDGVFELAERALVEEPARAEALRRQEVRALLRWADWCDGFSRRPLLPQSFQPERWQGSELRARASELVLTIALGALDAGRIEAVTALLDDPPAPVDARHDRLLRVLTAVGVPNALDLTLPQPGERADVAAVLEPLLGEIETLHEPECKRLDRPGAPYDEWVFEQTALLMGIYAACTGDWRRAYDHADELAWSRGDRSVPVGVMYLLALAAAMETDALALPRPNDTAADVTDTPEGRAFDVASDLRAALEHGYEPDLDELADLLARLRIDTASATGSLDRTTGGPPRAERRAAAVTWDDETAALHAELLRRRAHQADMLARAQAHADAARADSAAATDVGTPDADDEWSDASADTALGLLEAGTAVSGDTLAGLADHLATPAAADPAPTADEGGGRARDERWLAVLDTHAARAGLGDDAADLERIRVLQRLGRTAAARAAATGLFWRAVNGTTGPAVNAADLADLVEELGAPAAELTPLRAALAPAAPATAAAPVAADQATPVRVVFVGGNEIQAQYHDEIERALPDRVDVQWFATGWSARWGPEAERIEAAYERADAVVLMQFTRTQLGRRLRRSAGEAGLPWIPCTGHGRDSLRRAIERAVAVVDGQRETARA